MFIRISDSEIENIKYNIQRLPFYYYDNDDGYKLMKNNTYTLKGRIYLYYAYITSEISYKWRKFRFPRKLEFVGGKATFCQYWYYRIVCRHHSRCIQNVKDFDHNLMIGCKHKRCPVKKTTHWYGKGK